MHIHMHMHMHMHMPTCLPHAPLASHLMATWPMGLAAARGGNPRNKDLRNLQGAHLELTSSHDSPTPYGATDSERACKREWTAAGTRCTTGHAPRGVGIVRSRQN